MRQLSGTWLRGCAVYIYAPARHVPATHDTDELLWRKRSLRVCRVCSMRVHAHRSYVSSVEAIVRYGMDDWEGCSDIAGKISTVQVFIHICHSLPDDADIFISSKQITFQQIHIALVCFSPTPLDLQTWHACDSLTPFFSTHRRVSTRRRTWLT